MIIGPKLKRRSFASASAISRGKKQHGDLLTIQREQRDQVEEEQHKIDHRKNVQHFIS